MDKERINYSQCWEDPQVLAEALSISPDDHVLSITSGGDNTLALILEGPQEVVSIDLNPAQNHLLELKMGAAKSLDYQEYLEFLGIKESTRRTALFEKVSRNMPATTKAWWLRHLDLVRRGAVHCGRFERFTAWFARSLLPLVHSTKTISRLLSCRTVDEQKILYRGEWDSRRWRFFFGLASNRLMLKRYARQRGMFTYAGEGTVADVYRQRLERHLASVPLQGNFFLRYSLTGTYGDALPPYLAEMGYTGLRSVPGPSLAITTNDLLSYLHSVPADTFSKFNLSDIFEALSPSDSDALWEEIFRTAKHDAVVAYWNNLVQRSYPTHLSSRILTDDEQVAKLRAKDRVFFYDSFHVHTIRK